MPQSMHSFPLNCFDIKCLNSVDPQREHGVMIALPLRSFHMYVLIVCERVMRVRWFAKLVFLSICRSDLKDDQLQL